MTERRTSNASPRRAPAPLPLFAHAERRGAGRQVVRPRRVRRHLQAVAALIGVALVAATIVAPPRPRLVWNASASAPLGLYAVTPGARVRRDDTVVAWAPPAPRRLAAERRYLPGNVPLVKRVRGVAGDRICAAGPTITVNGRPVAVRKARDAAGRALPWWQGCVTLGNDALFLLMDAAGSFDGRYFGPSRTSDVIGTATALWLR